MSSAFSSFTPTTSVFTWDEALREFLLYLKATRAKKTQQFCRVQVGGLAQWGARNAVPFAGFGKRPLGPSRMSPLSTSEQASMWVCRVQATGKSDDAPRRAHS